MVSVTILAILFVFAYMQWRRFSHFNRRQLIICRTALQQLLAKARSAGETNETIEILFNAAISTYNESLRGPWFYTHTWKIPPYEFKEKKNEIKRHSERGHSDSESDIEEGEE